MKQALQTTSNVVAVDFAGGVSVSCDMAFYQRLLAALTGTLEYLLSQVPEGRELADVATVICEDNKSLMTCGYLDGSYAMIDIAAGVQGIEYDRGNPLTHPELIDRALRWLASKRTAALN